MRISSGSQTLTIVDTYTFYMYRYLTYMTVHNTYMFYIYIDMYIHIHIPPIYIYIHTHLYVYVFKMTWLHIHMILPISIHMHHFTMSAATGQYLRVGWTHLHGVDSCLRRSLSSHQRVAGLLKLLREHTENCITDKYYLCVYIYIYTYTFV